MWRQSFARYYIVLISSFETCHCYIGIIIFLKIQDNHRLSFIYSFYFYFEDFIIHVSFSLLKIHVYSPFFSFKLVFAFTKYMNIVPGFALAYKDAELKGKFLFPSYFLNV